MIGITCNIQGSTLSVINCLPLVTGGRRQFTAQFVLDQHWEDRSLVAVFSRERTAYRMSILEGQCAIPQEVLETGGFWLGVVGVTEADTYATLPAFVAVNPGVPDGGASPLEPTPSLWEQYVQECATAAMESTENASRAVLYAQSAQMAATTATAQSQLAQSASASAQNDANDCEAYMETTLAAKDQAVAISKSIWRPSVNTNGDLFWEKSQREVAPPVVNLKGAPGRDAVAVATDGMVAFHIDDDGHLIVTYTGEVAPSYFINDNGHLCVNI